MEIIMDLKTVIFDLDGTILNTIFDLKEAVNFALVKLGYKERTLKEIREFIGNGLTKLMIRSLGKNEEKEPDENPRRCASCNEWVRDWRTVEILYRPRKQYLYLS